jgi:hypothetical protein
MTGGFSYKEINIVVNELAFQLTARTGNLDKALYWLNWILEWEKLNIKKSDGFNGFRGYG